MRSKRALLRALPIAAAAMGIVVWFIFGHYLPGAATSADDASCNVTGSAEYAAPAGSTATVTAGSRMEVVLEQPPGT